MCAGRQVCAGTMLANTLAKFDHRLLLVVGTRCHMGEAVLWQDEIALLRRLADAGGILPLTMGPSEKAAADHLCRRGFGIRSQRVVRLSELGHRAARIALKRGGPVVRISAGDLTEC